MSTPKDSDPIINLLVEHDEVTLSLSDEGKIKVSVSGLGVTYVDSIIDLLPALTTDAIWEQPTRSRHEPRGTVLKASPNKDLYGIWSDNVDNLVDAGTKADLLRKGVQPSRIARADIYGTSARLIDMPAPYPNPYRDGGWDDKGFVVHNQNDQSGWLPRYKLPQFITLSLEDKDDEAAALLEPFED